MAGKRAARRLGVAATVAIRRLLGAGRLPDFLIIGAQKAGTTALYNHLCGHPDVVPAMRKEVHFFDREYRRGLAWYCAHFWRTERVTGEATPYYLFHPAAPVRAQEMVPDTRLVVLLRNPIDRAVSHYEHTRSRGLEPLPIQTAFECEAARLASATARSDDSPSAYRIYSYLARGIYADQLLRWFAHYPRERILVVRSEALWRNPKAVASVYEFLGLMPDARRFVTVNPGSYQTSATDVRCKLKVFYRPHNERLSTLLGEDWTWTDSAP